jgi:hypothetical protein
VEATPAILEQKPYTVLVPGRYPIESRQSIQDSRNMILNGIGSGRPTILTVVLVCSLSKHHWGEIRQVIATRIVKNIDGHLEFDGVMANGPALVPIRAAFFGVTDGYVELLELEK